MKKIAEKIEIFYKPLVLLLLVFIAYHSSKHSTEVDGYVLVCGDVSIKQDRDESLLVKVKDNYPVKVEIQK